MLLASCAEAGSSFVACPRLRAYTVQEQTQAALELARLGGGSMIGRMMADYGALRDAVRAVPQCGAR